MTSAPTGDAPAFPGLRVRGQPAATAAGLDLVRSGRAQSILLVGPSGVGKTTLALDLAAVVLCTAEPDARPCRACRGCRTVASGNHPDLHRLAPEGPGGQIRIGSPTDAEPGTVRRLVTDLSLHPVEGGWRVVLVEHADRMNEDAQAALLKTLEEPPGRVLLLLCADEEERLLPTVRSRCARLRLGPLGAREIETLLGELDAADPPTAARLGRLAAGRPGVALAWAAAPGAVVARGEIVRSLLDLLDAPRTARLAAVRALLATSGEAVAALAGPAASATPRTTGARRRGAGPPPPPSPPPGAEPDPAPDGDGADPVAEAAATRRAPAAERRRAALLLVDVWRSVTRDLALAQLGDLRSVRDPALLDEIAAAAAGLESGAAARFLGRLDRAGELLESNVGPELVADSLVIAWPRRTAAR